MRLSASLEWRGCPLHSSDDRALISGVIFVVDSCTRNTLEIRSLPSVLHFWKVKIRSGIVRPRRSKVRGSHGTPKRGSKFQNGNFAILTADLDSSQKSSWRIYFYFFHFLRKRGSKGGSKVKKDPKIDPSNHFLSQNFKMGILPFWQQIWILLKKVAEESTFIFFIF